MANSWTERIIMLVALVVAVMIHEVAHGLAAFWCGDTTARDAGRLSLNPLRHVDPIGTIVLPGLLVLTGSSVVFGWAKPVPISLGNTRNPRFALWFTALAGPFSNLLQIFLASVIWRTLALTGLAHSTPQSLLVLLYMVGVINAVLMIFNMLPIPPLDGSRVMAAILPAQLARSYLSIERFGFIIIFLLLRNDLLSPVIEPLLNFTIKVAFG